MRLKKKKIYFREARSIGSMVGDTLRYIRQHFGDIIRTLLFVGGPYVLAVSVLALIYQSEVGEFHLGLMGVNREADYFMDTVFMWVMIGSILYLGRAFLAATVAAFMLAQERAGLGKVETSDITREVWSKSPKILWTAFCALLLLWCVIAFFATMIYLVFQVSDPLGWLFSFLVGVGLLIFFFPYSYLNASLFLIVFKENKSGFRAIGKGFKVLRGNFWQAWVVFWMASAALWGALWLLKQPADVYAIIQEEFAAEQVLEYENYGLVMILLSLAWNFVTTLIDGFYYILGNFQFYSNEERASGDGLKKRILDIGAGQTYRDFEPSY